MNSGVVFIIILFVLYSLIFGKSKKTKKRRNSSSSPKKNQVVLSGPYTVKDKRRYIAETVPVLLQDYNVLLPGYYSCFAAEFLRSGHLAKIEQDDLVEGVERGYAFWVLNHCTYLASMRFTGINMIENAEKVEAKRIKFSVFRSNPSCPHVPQDKIYKINDKIPVYPCADCKEEKPCVFNYAYDW